MGTPSPSMYTNYRDYGMVSNTPTSATPTPTPVVAQAYSLPSTPFPSPFCARSPFTPKIAALAMQSLSVSGSQSQYGSGSGSGSADVFDAPVYPVFVNTHGFTACAEGAGEGEGVDRSESCGSLNIGLRSMQFSSASPFSQVPSTPVSSSPRGSSHPYVAPSIQGLGSMSEQALSKYSKHTFVKYSSDGGISIARVAEDCFMNDVFARVQNMGDISSEGTAFVLLRDEVLLPMESIVSPIDLEPLQDEDQLKTWMDDLQLNNEVSGEARLSFEGAALSLPVEVFCMSQMQLKLFL